MKRIYSLQGLRAAAFLLIFLGHCNFFGLAGAGVSVFFVLSGFLMVYNYFGKELGTVSIKSNFYNAVKKISKLYPLHLIMLFPMLVLALYTLLKDFSLLGFLKEIILPLTSNLLLVQSWIPIRSYYFGFNGVAWYLSVTLFLYFVFPWFLKKIKTGCSKKKAVVLIVAVFVVQILSAIGFERLLPEQTNWFTYIFPIYRAGDFFAGACLGYIFLSENKKAESGKFKATVIEILAILFFAGICAVEKYVALPESLKYSVVFLPGSMLLVYVLAKEKGAISSFLSLKPVVEFGNLSTYTFLIHQVIINYVWIVCNNQYLVALISFAVTIALAFAYKWFDKKVIVKIRKAK